MTRTQPAQEPARELDEGTLQQASSMLGQRFLDPGGGAVGELYGHRWPPVPQFERLPADLRSFLHAPAREQASTLSALRADPDRHGRFLHLGLADIYAYLFGYRDGPCTRAADDDLEALLCAARIRLEREFLDHWLQDPPAPAVSDQRAAADHLEALAETNPGVDHPLFEYLCHDAPREHLDAFLRGEVIRNEVVDDEVALLVVGLQGTQKAVVAANLFDECGRGRLEHFHTFWLRQFIAASDGGWTGFARQRAANPWFAKITSNAFAMLLTRPAFKQLAYGCFLVFESWVEPHFRKILGAMDRLGITDRGRRIYFAAHVAVDPRHAHELCDGVRFQRPELDARELRNVVSGAHVAAECGRRQYDAWLQHFTGESPVR